MRCASTGRLQPTYVTERGISIPRVVRARGRVMACHKRNVTSSYTSIPPSPSSTAHRPPEELVGARRRARLPRAGRHRPRRALRRDGVRPGRPGRRHRPDHRRRADPDSTARTSPCSPAHGTGYANLSRLITEAHRLPRSARAVEPPAASSRDGRRDDGKRVGAVREPPSLLAERPLSPSPLPPTKGEGGR